MRVDEVMTSSVRTCRPGDALHVVMQAMWEHDLGALPVVDDCGRPVAMITDRDVAVAVYTQGKLLHEIQVCSTMSKGVVTAHAQDRLSWAERTMRHHQLRRLPVVDESGRLVGILSLHDIARVRSAATTRVAEHRDLAVTMAAIAAKRQPLSLEEYASQQVVSFHPSSPVKAARPLSKATRRERQRSAMPQDSGVFPSAAAPASLSDAKAASNAS